MVRLVAVFCPPRLQVVARGRGDGEDEIRSDERARVHLVVVHHRLIPRLAQRDEVVEDKRRAQSVETCIVQRDGEAGNVVASYVWHLGDQEPASLELAVADPEMQRNSGFATGPGGAARRTRTTHRATPVRRGRVPHARRTTGLV